MEKKTAEQCLRNAFGEELIEQNHKFQEAMAALPMAYPDSRQRYFIYKAMEEYASIVTEEKDERIKELEELIKKIKSLRESYGVTLPTPIWDEITNIK